MVAGPKTLRDLMAERKVRAVDIARFIPVSQAAASAWRTGRYLPTGYHRDRLRLLLAVSEDELNAALERDGGKHG